MANLVTNNDFFKVWHQRNIGKVSNKVINSTRSADLGFSKQRFDNPQEPMGRCILKLEALIVTMQQIAESRRGSDEAQRAFEFLEYIAES